MYRGERANAKQSPDPLNKVAVITGAASGIGLATAERLVRDGWYLIGIDRQERPAALSQIDWQTCDLGDYAAVAATIASLADKSIDALILCAGVAGIGAVERVLRINAFANRQLLDGLGSQLRDGGSITLMSSGAGWRWSEQVSMLRACLREPDEAKAVAQAAATCPSAAEAYVRSKELLCVMAALRCLDHWYRHVRLNSVSPGGVETPLIADFTRSMGQEAMDFSARLVGRHAAVEEVARVVAFLTSDSAAWINGTDIRVDGGLVGALASGAADYDAWTH